MAAAVPARLSAAEGRKFAFTLMGAFAVLAAVLLWREKALAAQGFGGVAVLFLVGGTVAPTAMGPVQRAWMGFAHALSKVTTPIFMGVVFYGVITPIGLLRRLLGKSSLVAESHDGSYWVLRDPPIGSASDLERQF